MSNDIFKNASFDFKCPSCNNNINVKVSSIGTMITCPHCNQAIELQDDGFSSSANEADKLVDKFGKDLKNMFK